MEISDIKVKEKKHKLAIIKNEEISTVIPINKSLEEFETSKSTNHRDSTRQ